MRFRLPLLQVENVDETLQAAGALLELLYPGVEERVGEALTISLGGTAVADHDAAEVAPFRHIIRQAVLLSNLPLSLLHAQLHGFHQVQEP